MVAEAPRFFEVAKDIVKMTEGAVVVAHNAQFDYSFIRKSTARWASPFPVITSVRSGWSENCCPDTAATAQAISASDSASRLKTVTAPPGMPSPPSGSLKCSSRMTGTAASQIGQKNDYLNLRFPPNIDRSLLDKLRNHPASITSTMKTVRSCTSGKSNNIRKVSLPFREQAKPESP